MYAVKNRIRFKICGTKPVITVLYYPRIFGLLGCNLPVMIFETSMITMDHVLAFGYISRQDKSINLKIISTCLSRQIESFGVYVMTADHWRPCFPLMVPLRLVVSTEAACLVENFF